MTDAEPTSSRATARTVDEIADEYVDALAALDPFEATFAGIAGHDAETTDLSPDGFAERAALARRTLGRLDDARSRDERERIAGEAMRERLGLQLEMHEAGLDRALSNIASPAQEVREVFDLMPTDTHDQWANIAARLRAVPDALDGYRRTLEADIASGLPPARRQVGEVVDQANRAAEDFFPALARQAPDALRAEAERLAGVASTAYADFVRYLADEVAPRGRTYDPVGRDTYRVASRYFLGAEVDLDESYAWGLEELARIEAEMAEVAERLAPGGTVADA
ncbi:MAG: DUF885 domain-containing protein, partial [Actinomycetota bacterium]